MHSDGTKVVYVFSPWLNALLMLENAKHKSWLMHAQFFELIADSLKTIWKLWWHRYVQIAYSYCTLYSMFLTTGNMNRHQRQWVFLWMVTLWFLNHVLCLIPLILRILLLCPCLVYDKTYIHWWDEFSEHKTLGRRFCRRWCWKLVLHKSHY